MYFIYLFLLLSFILCSIFLQLFSFSYCFNVFLGNDFLYPTDKEKIEVGRILVILHAHFSNLTFFWKFIDYNNSRVSNGKNKPLKTRKIFRVFHAFRGLSRLNFTLKFKLSYASYRTWF